MSAGTGSPGCQQYGRIEIWAQQRRLQVDGEPVNLGSRAFDLLAALVARRDRVVPKDELIELVWPGLVVEDNNLQVQISALRKALGPQTIATVPGRGYRFAVAAAAVGASAPADEAQSSQVAARQRTGARPSHLLVADDNRLNRLLLCRSLELMGHDVATVVNGREALERLRSAPFDLLLLDLEMPELDGFALLELRAADPVLREIPVIVTSALEGAAHVARCIELGADDYLHKPPNPVLLQARVDASLERKHLRDRERQLLARLLPGMASNDRHAAGPSAIGRRAEVTLLRADLDDVDALGETPTATLALLGDWSTVMVDAIEEHGGLVTQLAGDSVSAAFGAGVDEGGGRPAGQAPWAAVQAALDMLELGAQLNRERSMAGKAAIRASIGIASGPAIVGEAGTRHRAAYACIGATARRAAQLQALAARGSTAADAVLLDPVTQAALAGRAVAHARPAVVLPGSTAALCVYALQGR